MAREELCTSPVNFNAYAELNVPNFGVDIEIPSDVDYYTVNQARRVSKDVVSKWVGSHVLKLLNNTLLCIVCSSCAFHVIPDNILPYVSDVKGIHMLNY